MKQIRAIVKWFNLHPKGTDLLVTAAFAGLAFLNLYVNWGAQPDIPPVFAILLTLLIMLPLLYRRNYPLAVLMFMTAGILVFRWFNIPESSFTVYALLLAFFSAGAYGQKKYRNWARLVCALLVNGWLAYSIFSGQSPAGLPAQTILYQLSVVLLNVFLFAAAWWIGEIFRILREREIQLEKERDENTRRAVFDERVRIARELHDVVAHHVSVMGIQAGAARRVLKQQPEKAHEMLSQIESSSRQAVGELQRLLGFLRQQNQADEIAPQPGLKQIEALLTQIRDAGLPVEMQISGKAAELPAGLDLSVYRIIQEALTNTLKHAGPASAVVRIEYRTSEIQIEIEDDGQAAETRQNENHGRGLMGMRERVGLHGGKFEAGRRPGNGFMVKATLPLRGWDK